MNLRVSSVWGCVAALWLALGSNASAETAAKPQVLPHIGEIRLTGVVDEVMRRELQALILQRPGEPLRLDELDYSLKLMLLRADVARAEVRIIPRGALRDLEWIVDRARIVERLRVHVEGRIGHGEERLTATGDLVRLPAVYDETLPAAIARRMRDDLRRVGYVDASVDLQVHWLDAYRGELVAVQTPGELFRVTEVVWLPQARSLPVTPPDLQGKVWDEVELQQELDDYLRELRRAGYLDAGGALDCRRGTEPHSAFCIATVEPRERVLVDFRGNRTYYDADLLAALAIDYGQRFTANDVWRRGSQVQDFYRRNGFFFAEVSAVVYSTADTAIVTYYINEKQRYQFRRIRIRGVDSELENEIIDAMEISSRAWERALFDKTRDVSAVKREADLERVVFTLNRHGYLAARVVNDEFVEVGNGVEWHIHVEPGKRYVWGRLELPDLASFGVDVDIPAELAPAAAANPFVLRDYAESLAQALRNVGYLDAVAQADLGPTATTTVVSGGIRLLAGPRYRVAGIMVRGMERTREAAVLDSLPLRLGDWAGDETLYLGRELLLERRVFQQVRSYWVLRDASVQRAVAVYDVVERNGGEVELGLLLTTAEGVGLDARLSHYRLFGTFRSLQAEGSTTYLPENLDRVFRADPHRMRWALRYREPFPRGLPIYAQAQATFELNRNDPDFDWRARSVSLGPYVRASERLDYGLDYVYEWFTRSDIRFDSIDDPGPDRIASLRLTALYDGFDNRFDPTRGWGTFHELQSAWHGLGGEYQFLRYEGSVRVLQPLVGIVSLWFAARFGWIGADPDGQQLPRFKTFRLGGSQSVRGYERDSVSPFRFARDSNSGELVAVPVGGDRFVSNQTELHIRIFESIGLAAFEDNAYVVGFDGSSVFAAGYGGGLLYHTPAGPLRLDYARKIAELATDLSVAQIHFYISTSF